MEPGQGSRIRCIPKSLLLVDLVLFFSCLWKEKNKKYIFTYSPPAPFPAAPNWFNEKATYRSFRSTNQILSLVCLELYRGTLSPLGGGRAFAGLSAHLGYSRQPSPSCPLTLQVSSIIASGIVPDRLHDNSEELFGISWDERVSTLRSLRALAVREGTLVVHGVHSAVQALDSPPESLPSWACSLLGKQTAIKLGNDHDCHRPPFTELTEK